jgi:hypothetical protein
MEREITMNRVSETESQEKNYSLKDTFTEWFVNLQVLGVPMLFKRKNLNNIKTYLACIILG